MKRFLVAAICAGSILPGAAISIAAAAADNPLQLTAAHAVTLTVANLDAETEWYESILGFKETMRHQELMPAEQMRRVELLGNRIDLIWHRYSTKLPAAKFPQGYDHVSYETTALDQDLQWLTSHNIKVQVDRNAKSNAIERLIIHDPEGNQIRIEAPHQ